MQNRCFGVSSIYTADLALRSFTLPTVTLAKEGVGGTLEVVGFYFIVGVICQLRN
jgi:hypothetical protein